MTEKNSFHNPFRDAVQQLSQSPMPGVGRKLDLQTLTEAFRIFNETTQQLEKAHRELEKRVQQVDAELERKNRQLAGTNNELQIKISELDRMRRYLNNLIDSMGSGLICIDENGRMTAFNRAAQQLTGWSEAEALSRDWKDKVSDESRQMLQSIFQEKNVRQNLDFYLLARSGDRVAVRGTTAPIVDENDCFQGTILTFIDQSGVKLLEERVRRAGRLAALGELAAGVAHEMRNPLTTIRGFIQIFPSESEDPEFRKEFASNVLREIDRLKKLTDDLLNLARPTHLELQATDARRLLEESTAFIAESSRERGVELQVEVPDRPVLVAMDRDRIKQVLLNLLINAVEAMPEGGRLKAGVKKSRVRLDSGDREDPYIVFSVQDTGGGIPKSQLERLFDPFFTTKEMGTGLGLAVSYRIAEEHDGFLQVESEVGQGSTFRLLLPVNQDSRIKETEQKR
jgi:PAS domain S-box-containing protein